MPFLGQHPLPPLQHRCLSSPLSEHFHVMVGSGVSTHRVSQGRSLLTAQPLAFSGPGFLIWKTVVPVVIVDEQVQTA